MIQLLARVGFLDLLKFSFFYSSSTQMKSTTRTPAMVANGMIGLIILPMLIVRLSYHIDVYVNFVSPPLKRRRVIL